MKFVMIASSYFPIQDVSNLRVHSYCKSLAKSGKSVLVLIVYPEYGEDFTSGFYEGVEYRFVTDKKYLSTNIFLKAYHRIMGLVMILKLIVKGRVDAVLSYHDNILTSLFVKCVTMWRGIPFVIDKTEYPYGFSKMTPVRKRIERLKLRLFDGFIVISKELKTFYSIFSKKVFLLPMTIDPNRFENVIAKEATVSYIALTFGVHNRDGLYESVIAYNKYLKMSRSPMHLYLIGDYNNLCKRFPECTSIGQYIAENNLKEFVHFLGKQPIESVPAILAGASCLLTTPSRYISGGFPTKLGEYMLSGIPVVATSAGEISEYVKDGYDIFLSTVGDWDDVAKNILYIEKNTSQAKFVGNNAIKTAKLRFNADTYVNDLINYITGLKKGNG